MNQPSSEGRRPEGRKVSKATQVWGALGAGVLFTLPYSCRLLSPNHLLIYHSGHPVQSVAAGMLIDFGFFSLLAFLLLPWLKRSGSLIWVPIGAGLAAALATATNAILGEANWHRYAFLAAAVVLLLALVWRLALPSVYRAYTRALAAIFVLAGFSALLILPQLIYVLFAEIPQGPTSYALVENGAGEAAQVRRSAQSAMPEQRRIVWLLFDELSYRQTFEHRFRGVELPEFDNLANSSVNFSQLQPTAYFTELAIPSFFIGTKVVHLRSNLLGMPAVKLAGEKGERSFDPHTTVFGEARREGWSTGIVGWYNPYCRILAGVLDFCYEKASTMIPSDMSPQFSAVHNALLPFGRKVTQFFVANRSREQDGDHRSDYLHLMRWSKTAIKNEKLRFLFIHLPVPHPPGIYPRGGGQAGPADYLDNLVLADHALRDLREAIAATASAGQTTLIVCSDHSWRVGMWRKSGDWSEEEEEASNGVFDPRPVLLIHFPGEHSGEVVSHPFDDVRIHDILAAMLRGELQDQADFDRWLDQGGRESGSRSPVVAHQREP